MLVLKSVMLSICFLSLSSPPHFFFAFLQVKRILELQLDFFNIWMHLYSFLMVALDNIYVLIIIV